ncbi:DinB family protein [Actinoplanes sp. GCM10030250]|uniref:DinB family protein n=1 Tax=Actinoplanes sp. GCM10030250 TaxID=3273376 RepID=UPI003615F289
MPGQVGPIANEQDGLLAYLAQMRYVIKLTAHGLTPEQLRATPSASPLSVGGLIKHCASTEEGWMTIVRGESQPADYQAYATNFRLADGESFDEVLARYDRVAEATEKTVNDIANLDHPVPIDHSVPWNPQDRDFWSLRWVLLHLIQETARHTGHADIVRESVDGGTAYPLMAAAEGWPETDWLKPWKPSV